MTEQETEKLAGLIVDRLQASVLKMPAEVAEILKESSGFLARMPISGGRWPFMMETQVMANGGIRIRLLTVDGSRAIWDRVLSP